MLRSFGCLSLLVIFLIAFDCKGSVMDYACLEITPKRLMEKPRFLTATDGALLAYWVHKPSIVSDQQKVLVFYHGGGAYQVDAYQQMAEELAEKHDMTCYLFDIRGHGYSAGNRGDALSVRRVLLDVQEAIVFVKQQNPEALLFVGGHSSGCGLLMNALQKGFVPADVAGMIFIAPFLGAESKLVLKSDFIKKVSVWRFIWHGITGYGLNQPAVYFNYPEWLRQRSPRLLDYYTVAMALAITPTDGDIYLQKILVPLHIIIGNNDKQISSALLQEWQKKGLLASTTTVTVVPSAGHFSILSATSSILCNKEQQ